MDHEVKGRTFTIQTPRVPGVNCASPDTLRLSVSRTLGVKVKGHSRTEVTTGEYTGDHALTGQDELGGERLTRRASSTESFASVAALVSSSHLREEQGSVGIHCMPAEKSKDSFTGSYTKDT